jgi:hypothetical protein
LSIISSSIEPSLSPALLKTLLPSTRSDEITSFGEVEVCMVDSCENVHRDIAMVSRLSGSRGRAAAGAQGGCT